MTKTTQYLFILSISPVQSFIAQARKTHDLYAGSCMLSVLTKKAIRLFKQYGGVVKFPDENTDSMPNRFTGIINTESNVLEIGRDIEKGLIEFFVTNAEDDICNALGCKQNDLPKGYAEQLANHLQVFWAFTEHTGDYAETYKLTEQKIGASKNIRKFNQYTYQAIVSDNDINKIVTITGERSRKCIIDGERNVKFYRSKQGEDNNALLNKKLFIDSQDEVFIVKRPDHNVKLRYIQDGEGLSAVSFAKRCFRKPEVEIENNEIIITKDDETDEFPSTAQITLAKLFDTAKQYEKLNFEIEAYKCALQEYQHEYQLYYVDNLNEKYFINQGFDTQILDALKCKQKNIKDALKQEGLKKELPKYYAIIIFDADNMGEWLEGKHTTMKDTEKFHKTLSNLLSKYGTNMKDYLDENFGRTVYAGGDDFFGFVNLENLFDVINHLRTCFRNQVGEKIPEATRDYTFSAGVVIAHYKMPLRTAINHARNMEKQAKNVENKNAMALAVIKNSGEISQTTYKWGHYNDKKAYILLDEIKAVINGIRNDFSNTFINHFAKMFSNVKIGNLEEQLPHKAICTILKKLIKNAAYDKENKQKTNDFYNALISLFSKAEYADFVSLLHICDFIVRNTNGK